MLLRHALLALLVGLLLPCYAVAPPTDRAKMYHAEAWEGTVTVTCRQTFTEKDDAMNIVYTLNINRGVTFHVTMNQRKRTLLTPKYELAIWNSDPDTSSVNAKANDVYTMKSEDQTTSDTFSASLGGQVPRQWVLLGIDPQSNRYNITVNTLTADATVVSGGEKTVERGGYETPCLDVENQVLPASGTTLSGSTELKGDYIVGIAHGLTQTARYTVSWNIHPAGPPPEFNIDKASFKEYQPGDNTGSVRIYSPKPDTSPALLRVYLTSVSNEPGMCLNSKDAGTEPDLEFDRAGNPTFTAPTQNGNTWMMETREEVREARVAIRSHDYGAYGVLRVEAKIKGEWKPVTMVGGTQPTVNYPLDEDDNKIADAWERQAGVYGKGYKADWDGENTPRLNGQAGDGLTLYEEYRGMMANGTHQRLSPTRKDLVVENHVPQAAAGIALFAQATGLHVVSVKAGELLANPNAADDTTVVNRRASTGHLGMQHGVRLVGGATQGRSAASVGGETVPRRDGAKVTHNPGEVKEIRVADNIAANIADFGQAAVNCDVAHELGHSVGAQHHGTVAAPLVERYLADATPYYPPLVTVYGADGVEVKTRPIKVQQEIGVPQNEMSGDDACIMAYSGVYSWALHQKVADGHVQYTYFNVGITPPGTHFCTSGVGTGINAPQHKPAPLFGDAAPDRGNCLGQMQVRDYPAPTK